MEESNRQYGKAVEEKNRRDGKSSEREESSKRQNNEREDTSCQRSTTGVAIVSTKTPSTHASNYLLCDMLPSWSSVVIYRGGNNKQSAAALRLSQYPTPFANIPSPTLDTGPRWGGSIYFTLKYGAGPNPKLLPWNDKVINDHNKQTDRHTSTLLVALAS
eukprot:scaffold118724_cov63-Phaeocystis_antarctica.AAC.3